MKMEYFLFIQDQCSLESELVGVLGCVQSDEKSFYFIRSQVSRSFTQFWFVCVQFKQVNIYRHFPSRNIEDLSFSGG